MPHSKVKEAVARILVDNGFLTHVNVEDATVGKTLIVTINDSASNARISHIRRASKPGRRQYVGADKIPTVKQGRGLVVVSTSRGMMSGFEAKKAGVGGEVICEVY
jgi:small subunit ribosomal protein S8